MYLGDDSVSTVIQRVRPGNLDQTSLLFTSLRSLLRDQKSLYRTECKGFIGRFYRNSLIPGIRGAGAGG
jgi:hypothetical protein